MKSRILLFVFSYIIWLLLCWSLDWQHVVTGIAVALFVSWMTGDMFVNRPHIYGNFERYAWLLYYIPIFIWECFKANLDVAMRVAHPDMPINPGIVKVKTKLKTDTGLTFLANSITLTPGTLSVDIDKEGGYLYIHWINVKEVEIEKASHAIVYKFEKILEKVFE